MLQGGATQDITKRDLVDLLQQIRYLKPHSWYFPMGKWLSQEQGHKYNVNFPALNSLKKWINLDYWIV